MYLENVSELILGRRDEQNARTSTVDIDSVVEVHHPVLRSKYNLAYFLAEYLVSTKRK